MLFESRPDPVLSAPAPPEGSYLSPPSFQPVLGNSADLLLDGERIFPSMLEAIGSATDSVSVEMYCFADDGVGRAFARALAERAEAGVRVRVLVDAAGCRLSPRTFFGWMRARGIRVLGVNPLRQFLRAPRRWRDHRKLVVVDDQVAFVGGVNLSREGTSVRKGGAGWHDAAVRVTGPVVAGLAASFEQVWRERAGTKERALSPLVPAPTGAMPALILESRPIGPGPFASVFRHAVRRARRRVWIANPYFLPPRRLRRSLKQAARRGADVRILVPGQSDCPFALWAAQRFYASFLRSGIRLFEWASSMMHAKVAVLDGCWSTIGSYNMDPLSLLRNRELNLVLFGREAGSRFEEMLEPDFERSPEIQLRAWRERGLIRRLREQVCSGFRLLF